MLNVEVKKRKLTSIKGGGQKVRKLLTNVWSKTILVGGRPVNSVHERFIIPLRCFLWRGQYFFVIHPLYDLFHALQGKLRPQISKSATFFHRWRFSVIQEFKQNVSGSNPAKRSRKLYKPNRSQIISIKEPNVKMKNRRPRPRPPVKTSYNGTSGSEEVKHHPDRHHCHHCHHYQVWESSMESIESSSAFTLKVKNTKNHKNQI